MTLTAPQVLSTPVSSVRTLKNPVVSQEEK